MSDDPFAFFNVRPKAVIQKIDEFSDLEISENHQGMALSLLLQEEGVVIPPWCMFFLHKGLVEIRRQLLYTEVSDIRKDSDVVQ